MADRGAAWQRADRCLCLAMVRAAAPHPRGVLLACSLLEELGRTGAPVTDGYYASNPKPKPHPKPKPKPKPKPNPNPNPKPHPHPNPKPNQVTTLEQKRQLCAASAAWNAKEPTCKTLLP